MSRLQRYLVAGLLVWVPVLVTLGVLKVLVELMDRTLLLLPVAYRPETLLGFNIPGLGVLATVIVLLGTGVLVANFFGRKLVEISEAILSRIPFIRTIYSGAKQIAERVFDENGNSFKRVVLLEYPRRGIWSLGFLTNEHLGEPATQSGRELVGVFVPTTPNPTSGFLVMVPPEDLQELDIRVDDALKMIISLGVAVPDRPASASARPLARANPDS